MSTVSRRRLSISIRALACAAAALVAGTASAGQIGQPLPAWSEGQLDIHHINTGRGEAMLLILPDGTSLLNDASGKTIERAPFLFPSRPDAGRPPGEWVARYVQKVLPAGAKALDYALLSHFHGDHIGAVDGTSPRTTLGGDYRLSGITHVAELVPINTLLDRAWPDYSSAPSNANMANYQRFTAWQAQHRGLKMERFQPGRGDQIRLLHNPDAYPQFEIRNLYASGQLWTGTGTASRAVMPPQEQRNGLTLDENKLSAAYRVRYGAFDYFAGGDLSSIDEELLPAPPIWLDVETPVGQASGPVDVMKANHHGSWDANNPSFLSALQPRVIVVTARADGHPAASTFRRMRSQRTWQGPRDIFLTHMSAATAATTYGIDGLPTPQGHVVVRVDAGGDRYRVFVLDDSNEARTVKAVFGPYASQ